MPATSRAPASTRPIAAATSAKPASTPSMLPVRSAITPSPETVQTCCALVRRSVVERGTRDRKRQLERDRLQSIGQRRFNETAPLLLAMAEASAQGPVFS
jgi:hypothetical protein